MCVLAVCCLLAPAVGFAQEGCLNTLVADTSDDGIGGTGLGDDDGIGGTGFSDDDGIGGTGFGEDDGIGGTGVYGTITGLGSICVNGLRIDYERDVSVMIFGEPSRASRLGVGHVVWVVAERPEPDQRAEHGRWVARSITAFNERVGRVEAIAADHIVVDGESIVWLDAAQLFAQPGEPGFEIGDWIAVSGLRRADGTLVASRVDRARPKQVATSVQLEWLLRDSSLSRFSVEGYLGTPAFAGFDIAAATDAPVEAGARVWVETVVESDGVRPTGVIEREYPGDVSIGPGADDDRASGVDANSDAARSVGRRASDHRLGSKPPGDRPARRSLREIWSQPGHVPRTRSVRPPRVDSPIDTRIDITVDTQVDVPVDVPIDVPIDIEIDPGRIDVDALGGR